MENILGLFKGKEPEDRDRIDPAKRERIFRPEATEDFIEAAGLINFKIAALKYLEDNSNDPDVKANAAFARGAMEKVLKIFLDRTMCHSFDTSTYRTGQVVAYDSKIFDYRDGEIKEGEAVVIINPPLKEDNRTIRVAGRVDRPTVETLDHVKAAAEDLTFAAKNRSVLSL